MNKIIFIGIIFAIFLVVSIGLIGHWALAKTESTAINLTIGIPKVGSGELAQSVTGVEEYISLLYQYGVVIAGILAAMMIMVAGGMWIAAAGNPSKVQKAKDMIISAIIGLVLALGSYSLLYLINPNLVRSPGITPGEVSTVQGKYCSGGEDADPVKDSSGRDVPPSETKCGQEYTDSEENKCWGKICLLDCKDRNQHCLCAQTPEEKIPGCKSINELMNYCGRTLKEMPWWGYICPPYCGMPSWFTDPRCEYAFHPDPVDFLVPNTDEYGHLQCQMETEYDNSCVATYLNCSKITSCGDYFRVGEIAGTVSWMGVYPKKSTDWNDFSEIAMSVCLSNHCGLDRTCYFHFAASGGVVCQ